MDRRQFLRLAGIGVIGGVGLEDWAALQSMRLRNAGRPRPISDGQPTGLGGVDPIYQQVSDSDNPLAVPALEAADPIMADGWSGGISPIMLNPRDLTGVVGTGAPPNPTMTALKTINGFDQKVYVSYLPAGNYLFWVSGYNGASVSRNFRFTVQAFSVVKPMLPWPGQIFWDEVDSYMYWDIFHDKPYQGSSDELLTYIVQTNVATGASFGEGWVVNVPYTAANILVQARYAIDGTASGHKIGPCYLAHLAS